MDEVVVGLNDFGMLFTFIFWNSFHFGTALGAYLFHLLTRSEQHNKWTFPRSVETAT